jgi:hypothetical protein
MKKICKDCTQMFEAREEWQNMCYACYKLWKAKTDPQIIYQKQFIRVSDVDGQWMRDNITDILMLCHPDKHGNSQLSNTITRQLVNIFKVNRSNNRGV